MQNFITLIPLLLGAMRLAEGFGGKKNGVVKKGFVVAIIKSGLHMLTKDLKEQDETWGLLEEPLGELIDLIAEILF